MPPAANKVNALFHACVMRRVPFAHQRSGQGKRQSAEKRGAKMRKRAQLVIYAAWWRTKEKVEVAGVTSAKGAAKRARRRAGAAAWRVRGGGRQSSAQSCVCA